MSRVRLGFHVRPRVKAALAAGLVTVVTAGCAATPQPTPTTTASIWAEHGPVVLAIGDDPNGSWATEVKLWNQSHPTEPVTLRELSADGTERHNALADAGRAKSGEFTVMALDSTWSPEFADNKWIAPLPASEFPTAGMLASAVAAGTYEGTLYGYPVSSDAGLLYYRKDLLDAMRVKPPTTWAGLEEACDRVLPQLRGVRCYGLSLQPSDAMTVTVAETITSAGGSLVAADHSVAVDSPAALAGVRWLASAVADGTVPAAAQGWQDDQGLSAFADGDLIFWRGWSTGWSQLQSANSMVAGKVGVALLPGRTGSGTAALGGVNLAISASARNAGTAADLIRWLGGEEVQRRLLERGSVAPALASLYSDQTLLTQLSYLPTLGEAIRSARPLPSTPKYPEVSTAIQQEIGPVLLGKAEAPKALAELQTRLTDLLK